MEQKSKTHIRPIVYVMISVFLIIGYAYLTSSLTINGASLLKKATWDVHFENVQVKDGSVTGDQVTQEPVIDTNKTTVSFHVNLKKPGDYYEFTVDAVNAGTIDAMINTITDFDLTEDQLKYLETSVTYEDGEEIQEKQQLLAGDFAVYKIVVSFKKDLEAGDLPSTAEELDLEFTVEYVQKDDTAIKRRAENKLYNVLKDEAEKGGLALKYTGEHQDSMDASLSTKDIYHWYADNDSDGVKIQNMNNVVFANQCWQMIRTTDTGGVRLVYNGEPLITQNDDHLSYDCGTERPNHMGSIKYSYSVSNGASYYYSSNYSISMSDDGKTVFTLENPIRVTLTTSNSATEIPIIANNYPYTCRTSSESGTCNTLYKVDSFVRNGTTEIIVNMYKSTNRDAIDYYLFNKVGYSPANVGYMFNKVYGVSYYQVLAKSTYNPQTLTDSYISTYGDYYFGDSYNISGNNYVLNNPVKGNTIENYPQSWSGKYVCLNSTSYSCSVMYYVALIKDGSTPVMERIEMKNGESFDHANKKYLFGDGLKTNSDGSFSLTGNVEEISILDWYDNYSRLKNKLICLSDFYYYDSVSNSYKCNDTRTDNKVDAIGYTTRTSHYYFDYHPVYKYGNDVSNEDDHYVLIGNDAYANSLQYAYNLDSSSSSNCFNDDMVNNCGYNTLSNSHYTCFNLSGICSEYYYVVHWAINSLHDYVRLTDGKKINADFLDTNNIFYDMFYSNDVNSTDSSIKEYIDNWYYNNLYSSYDSFIEDSIYCNDRTISSFGGWSPTNGNLRSSLVFGGITTDSLLCERELDRFSVNNPVAKLNYKIALLTNVELKLFNNKNARAASNGYWLMTPNSFYSTRDIISYVRYDGSLSGAYIDDFTSYQLIRPAISLKPGIIYISGDGSKDNPYIIDTN